jgi:ATP-dependent Lhr-like helicase
MVQTLGVTTVDREILFEEAGILAMGQAGERDFGYRNFMELVSVFSSPPLVSVFYGQSEIGQVHELTFQVRVEAPTVLMLAGGGWVVNHIDWARRRAYVEATDVAGRSRWAGTAQPMHLMLSQAVAEVLGGAELAIILSKRAHAQLQEALAEHFWVERGATILIHRQSGVIEWWNFAGHMFNTAMAEYCRRLGLEASGNHSAVTVWGNADIKAIRSAIRRLVSEAFTALEMPFSKNVLSERKFSACVPDDLLIHMLAKRMDPSSTFEVLRAQRVGLVHVP